MKQKRKLNYIFINPNNEEDTKKLLENFFCDMYKEKIKAAILENKI